MKLSAFAVLLLLPATSFAEKYTVRDEGDFMPAGQRIEFADRYGWRSYKVEFDFGLESGSRALTKGSKLTVKVAKRDGKTWDYTCKAKAASPLVANINFLYGKGISIVSECRIPEKEFARAVGLHADDVGLPNLVFQVVIQDGQVKPGAQRGLYFLPGGQIESSDLNAYALNNEDPSSLAVVFRSN